MARRRLLWRLYPSYLLITLLALVAVSWYASRSFKRFYLEELEVELTALSRLAEYALRPLVAVGDPEALNAVCRELALVSSARLTVMLPDGVVVADSHKNPARMDNHAGRPEIKAALAGRTGSAIRFSGTLERDMMYVAVPLSLEGRLAAVVRAAVPSSRVDQTLSAIYARIAAGALAVALLAAGLSLVVSRRISRPLETMREGAERFAAGDLSHRLETTETLELAVLADSLNQMAAKLDERLRTVTKQKDEQEAMLSSMVEGVLAVDAEERVINMNQAAGRILGVDPGEVTDRTLPEAVRSTQLQRLVSKALASEQTTSDALVVGSDRDRLIQAQVTPLSGEAGGALVVLNDVTRLQQLERVRSDFVANVSHELRTPITSIKAAVETLRDGAIHDSADASRFLEIVARQSERMGAIIDDLLTLSRIEQDSHKGNVELQEGPLHEVVLAAVETCETEAGAKRIRIETACDDEFRARLNAPLLEQALVNLLSNAIKYSDEGTTVRVDVEASDDTIAIHVRDRGCGIAREHLPRLFERFYRVDVARSRKLGGTGLGLAITKHIMQAHGGGAKVESRPGQGSTFTLHLPRV